VSRHGWRCRRRGTSQRRQEQHASATANNQRQARAIGSSADRRLRRFRLLPGSTPGRRLPAKRVSRARLRDPATEPARRDRLASWGLRVNQATGLGLRRTPRAPPNRRGASRSARAASQVVAWRMMFLAPPSASSHWARYAAPSARPARRGCQRQPEQARKARLRMVSWRDDDMASLDHYLRQSEPMGKAQGLPAKVRLGKIDPA
jgi:hypothetical protein